MHGMKFNFVEAFLQFVEAFLQYVSREVVDSVDSTVWIKGIGRTIPRADNRAVINISFQRRYDGGSVDAELR
jgi:cytochrome b subunit of formate dehydrogenase